MIQNMEVEPQPLNQDVDLMLNTHQVTIQSPPPLIAEEAPSGEDELVPLEGLVMDTYNLTYDELQKIIVQARKKHFLDDLTSSTFIRERVIVTNTRRNMNVIVAANLAFIGIIKSNMEYLMTEKKQLEKDLQAIR